MRVVSTLAAVGNYPVNRKKETHFCCKEIRFIDMLHFLVIKSRQHCVKHKKGAAYLGEPKTQANLCVTGVCTVRFSLKFLASMYYME